jgi:hypothetical protein
MEPPKCQTRREVLVDDGCELGFVQWGKPRTSGVFSMAPWPPLIPKGYISMIRCLFHCNPMMIDNDHYSQYDYIQ